MSRGVEPVTAFPTQATTIGGRQPMGGTGVDADGDDADANRR